MILFILGRASLQQSTDLIAGLYLNAKKGKASEEKKGRKG